MILVNYFVAGHGFAASKVIEGRYSLKLALSMILGRQGRGPGGMAVLNRSGCLIYIPHRQPKLPHFRHAFLDPSRKFEFPADFFGTGFSEYVRHSVYQIRRGIR